MRSTSALPDRVCPLDSENASLGVAGGKGTNLARLARAGFPVPDGFIVTTYAYETFVTANRLAERIDAELEPIVTASDTAANPKPELLDTISATITTLFRSTPLSKELVAAIRIARGGLGGAAVAVRSSATAEDLPDLSFAGQQETFLNVVGDDQLLEAIVGCWASLWTSRAIGYRARNHIPQDGISLAVVVQKMVESEASGVMFTANPLTGLRSETVIEATVGLGEALVSGRVEPDRFSVDARAPRILERTIGAKRVAIRSRGGGGTMEVDDRDGRAGRKAAVNDDRVLELALMGSRVAEIYGVPQDIEWALSRGKLYLLQSRAITSLFPIPEGMPSDELQVLFSFAAIQGLMDPITPLGADMLRQVFASASHIFGYPYTRDTQPVLLEAGGRLWVNFTSLLRNSVGRRVARGGLAFIEPTVRQALEAVWEDPRLRPVGRGIRVSTLLRLARFLGPVAGNLIRNMIAPRRRRRQLEARAEDLLDRVRRIPEPEGSTVDRLHAAGAAVEQVFNRLIPPMFIRLLSGVATGMVSLNLLNSVAKRVDASEHNPQHGMSDLVLETTRGVPNNPTTKMDLSLWRVAKMIREDRTISAALDGLRPEELAQRYAEGALPGRIQTAVAQFLERYGARGLAEIDTGRERWGDEPEHLFEMLEGYLRIEDPDRAPDVVFARSSSQAERAIETLADAARASAPGPRGAARAARVHFAAKRGRAFLGFREYPKFFAIRMMEVFRRRLKAIGGEMAREGYLARPDDLFYLTLSEQQLFGTDALPEEEARELVETRRESYRRELMRRQIPRLLLSDGRAFYEGLADRASDAATEHSGSNTAQERKSMTGSPVSPGAIEGNVRVVLDPRASRLQPGEILVCPGTDPSWTPLFLIAAGLIMEVGGMMTHGAVVAREYGIPAVVGVHEATLRLVTGQRIRLDGSSGRITLLDSLPE